MFAKYCRVILCLFVSLNAHAADHGAVDLGDEQALLFSELPSVFSASRHEQPVTQAPAAVDIITSEHIKRYGWRTLAALLSSLSGFITTYDRAYHHIGVRGFAPPGDYNTRILVLIDGHRVNESLQDYAGLGQDFPIDIENIERVEVVRGPASALYGSSALFAVVNVITQRGRDLQGVRAQADLGSYGMHRGHVAFGKKFGEGVETFLSATHQYSDGHERLYFPGLGTAYDQDREVIDRLFGKVAWNDFTLSGAWLGRKKYLPTGTTGASFGESDTNYHDRRAYADLHYHHNFTGDWAVTARLFWDSYQFDDILPYRISPTERIVNRDFWQGEWFGGEVLLSHTFFDSHRVTFGSEYRHNYLQWMANSDVDPYYLYADNHQSSGIFGVYVQDEWTILDALRLQAGGRYDRYDYFGGTFNPRLGLIYTPFSDTTLKFLYGKAFRAPNAFESIYTCCESSTPWIGNLQLHPEEIETFEVVWEQHLNAHFDLRVSPYYNRLTNLISLTQSPEGIRQFQNQGGAEAHGVETQLIARYEQFEGRVSYTYQDSRVAGYPEAPNAPQQMVKFNASAPLWQDQLFVGVEVQYVDRRATGRGGKVSDYTITNLTLLTRRWLPGLELSGGLYNLFDERYADPASLPLLPEMITQDGRHFRVRLNYEF